MELWRDADKKLTMSKGLGILNLIDYIWLYVKICLSRRDRSMTRKSKAYVEVMFGS